MKDLMIQEGVHFVDLQRICFARRGGLSVPATACRAGTPPRRVRALISGTVPGTGRRQMAPGGSFATCRCSGFFSRMGVLFLRLWRGAFIVNWDEGIGRARVVWQWGR
jgi:hypothetical protein